MYKTTKDGQSYKVSSCKRTFTGVYPKKMHDIYYKKWVNDQVYREATVYLNAHDLTTYCVRIQIANKYRYKYPGGSCIAMNKSLRVAQKIAREYILTGKYVNFGKVVVDEDYTDT